MRGTAGRITLWGIEVFVACVEEASISAAARRLGASPATVSQQVTNLEGALGVTLLDRSARPMVPTPAGRMFLARANVILSEAEQARAELAMADLSRLTRLRLGMIEDFDADVTPRLLSGMAQELRNCRFLLETGASHRLIGMLDTRALDVIVATETEDTRPGLDRHPLLEEPFVAAVPKALAGADLRRLRRLPLIRYTSRHWMGRAIAAHLQAQDLSLPQRFEMDSYHAILATVADGAGWTILTPLGWMRARRFRDEVAVIPLPMAPLCRRITLTARTGALGDMPDRIAARLRPELEALVVRPAIEALPWLAGSMRVL